MLIFRLFIPGFVCKLMFIPMFVFLFIVFIFMPIVGVEVVLMPPMLDSIPPWLFPMLVNPPKFIAKMSLVLFFGSKDQSVELLFIPTSLGCSC